MDTANITSAATDALQRFYLAELDERVQRSEVVGAITLPKGNAALFYDSATEKFTLVEKLPGVEEAHVYDCVPREQWGRKVMLFGHATATGGYIASGHATLDENKLKVKLVNGAFYRMEVDATLAHLQPFVFFESLQPKARRGKTRRLALGASSTKAGRGQDKRSSKIPGLVEPPGLVSPIPSLEIQEDSEDLTEEDLRRLRGEISLNANPKKKWKH